MASRFALTSKKLAKVDGQQGLVYKTLESLGSATVEELAKAITPEVKTVQTPERIAAYYVCVLKKSGHIAPVSAEPTLDELVARRDALEVQYEDAIAAVEAARAAIAAAHEADVEVDAEQPAE